MLNWQKQLWFVVFIMFRLKMLQSLVNQTYAPTHLLLAVELQELRLHWKLQTAIKSLSG